MIVEYQRNIISKESHRIDIMIRPSFISTAYIALICEVSSHNETYDDIWKATHEIICEVDGADI